MNNIEIFKTWAPDGKRWTQWAKPVLFASMTGTAYSDPYGVRGASTKPGKLPWMLSMERDTAVIVDLHGTESVTEGIALAGVGYRPVPLFNGVNAFENLALVKVGMLAEMLGKNAPLLSDLAIDDDAPPAFLLDANRMNNGRKGAPGMFDNRWHTFPQDFPSADCFLAHGITRIVVRTQKLADDLQYILRRFQDKGICILLCGYNEAPQKTVVRKPSRFRRIAYRFLMSIGLRRNAAGGFGGKIPDPQSSGYHGG